MEWYANLRTNSEDKYHMIFTTIFYCHKCLYCHISHSFCPSSTSQDVFYPLDAFIKILLWEIKFYKLNLFFWLSIILDEIYATEV